MIALGENHVRMRLRANIEDALFQLQTEEGADEAETVFIGALPLGDASTSRFQLSMPEASAMSCRIEVVREFEASSDIYEGFNALADMRLPEGSQLEEGDPDLLDAQGRLKQPHWVPASVLPAFLVSYFDEAENELEAHASRIAALLRWRYRLSGPLRPISKKVFEWSLDGKQWRQTSRGPAIRFELGVLVVADVDAHGFGELVSSDLTEPLAHELLREARDLADQSPRAALIVAVSALETGVSGFIGELVPDAKWLIDQQLPYVVKILRDYLHTLPVRSQFKNGVLRPSREIVDTIRNAVERRNRVAHRGEDIEDLEWLDEAMRAIEQVLYLLDFYQGRRWARQNIFATSVRPI